MRGDIAVPNGSGYDCDNLDLVPVGSVKSNHGVTPGHKSWICRIFVSYITVILFLNHYLFTSFYKRVIIFIHVICIYIIGPS